MQRFSQASMVACLAFWPLVSLAQYSVTPIPGLPGGYDMSYPSDLNDRGHVVGTAVSMNSLRAYSWINGEIAALALTRDFEMSIARGINTHAQVVGSQQSPQPARAVVWSENSILDLGTIGPYISSAGDRINDRGEIVGRLPTAVGADPFLWRNGVMHSFRELPGGSDFVHIADINNNGLILGNSARTEASQRSLLWQEGTVTILDDLPGGTGLYVPTGVWSEPNALNDRGDVVGVSDGANGIHAFLWSNGEISDLGALIDNWSEAADINNHGVVVGFTGLGYPHAFVWDATNGMRDLNDLLDGSGAGWTLRNATAINNVGQIVGWGELNGQQSGFFLTPIPEPSTWLMGTFALAIVMLFSRMRSYYV